jgi:hypothetical protein
LDDDIAQIGGLLVADERKIVLLELEVVNIEASYQ